MYHVLNILSPLTAPDTIFIFMHTSVLVMLACSLSHLELNFAICRPQVWKIRNTLRERKLRCAQWNQNKMIHEHKKFVLSMVFASTKNLIILTSFFPQFWRMSTVFLMHILLFRQSEESIKAR